MSQSIGKYLMAEQYTGSTWAIHTKKDGDLLGTVDWCDDWDCYEFQPEHATGFDAKCLRDIANFLEKITNETPSD